MWTAFDYVYRDAGNFKAFGTVILEGRVSSADQELIRCRLDSREFFIAEQVGVRPLYGELSKWSGGRTTADHCWHEFVGVYPSGEPENPDDAVSAREFVARFAAADAWNERLSPQFRTEQES